MTAKSDAWDKMDQILKTAQKEKRGLTIAEQGAFDNAEREYRMAVLPSGEVYRETRGTDEPQLGTRAHTVSVEVTRRAAGLEKLIGRDTHDLPSPDKPIEARHDVMAWLSQRSDFNPTNIDLGSFDRDSLYRQIMTGNQAGREYRALAEGAQSATASGGGVTVPIAFSGNILPLLRAALLFTAEGADGSLNGPAVYPMRTQLEYYPTWNGDATGVASYVAENTAMTPGTATLGRGQLTAWTIASVQLASRQLVDDSDLANGALSDVIESNTALAIARQMDQSALYGPGAGSNQPWGIFSSNYSSTIQTVSMGTNGAAPTDYGQISQAVEKVRNQNESGDLLIATNPSVFGTYSRLNASTYAKYWEPPQDVAPFWPPRTSTAFSATETQGTSSDASSVLVLNPSRVIMGMRTQGIQFMTLDQRYMDYLQYGFVAYLRHDWAFPYAAQTARVQGILTT